MSAASRGFLELLPCRKTGTITRRLSGDTTSLGGKDLLVSAVHMHAIATSPEIEALCPSHPT